MSNKTIEPETKEIPESLFNTAEAQEKLEELKPLCETPDQFTDVALKVALLEVILSQVNEIFISSLYPPTATALIESANESVKHMQDTVAETYVKNSLAIGELMPIPDISEIAYWVEEVHKEIAQQLYTEGFVDTVFMPALETVTSSVVEFAKEEADGAAASQEA